MRSVPLPVVTLEVRMHARHHYGGRAPCQMLNHLLDLHCPHPVVLTFCSKLTLMATGRVLMARGHSVAPRRPRSVNPLPQTPPSRHKILLPTPLRFQRTISPLLSIHLVPSVTPRRNCWRSTKTHTTRHKPMLRTCTCPTGIHHKSTAVLPEAGVRVEIRAQSLRIQQCVGIPMGW